MFEFKIIKKSAKSRARIGILKTSHGEIETPSLVAVGTNATVKTLTSEEIVKTKTQIIIANTFHLHLKPGENIIHKSGGLHGFMNWEGPIMTDSGGFQVFSLGFGHDLKVGKILKYFPGENKDLVYENSTPLNLNITEEGVSFRSPFEDKEIFLGPSQSMNIQKKLGADIIFTFDECTPPLCSYPYAKKALERTHKWAKICRDSVNSKQVLFGIVQGSKFEELRKESAKYIDSLDFPGYGIGGDMGESKKQTEDILIWTIPLLDEAKPRHLLGIGYIEDMGLIIRNGTDLFDCTVPTHYGRRGIAFTDEGRFDLSKSKFLKDREPLDKRCFCFVCGTYKRNYISHLIKAKEITGLKLLTFHNLHFFNTFVENIRKKIKKGEL